MNEPRTYLDYNATAPLRRGARVAMTAALGLPGNASSVHGEGREARKVIELARQSVAELLGASPTGVAFTSGGTEANNWALCGGWDVIFLAGIEHDSVLASAQAAVERHGTTIVALPVDNNGVVPPDRVAEILDQYPGGADGGGEAKISDVSDPTSMPGRALLTLQMANNETGVVQPVAENFALAKSRGIATHCDAVQAVGRLPFSFGELGADLLSVSGHKLGGPKGVGALVIGDGVKLASLLLGGGQEFRLRAGTENIAAIAGFGSAAEAVAHELGAGSRLRAMRDLLERRVKEITPDVMVVGEQADRLANTSCLAMPGEAAETLVIKLDLAGIAVSAGAACSSGKVGISHVLRAMGLADDIASSAIRVSLGWGSSTYDIDAFIEVWQRINQSKAPRTAVA